MTEKEAVKALRLEGGLEITGKTKRVVDFFEGLDMAIKALEEIQQYRAIGTAEECREAVEKQNPKKIIIRNWSSTFCPTCGHELSTSLGDGYYKHPTFLERCPKCGQVIQWDENLEGMEDERDLLQRHRRVGNKM